MIPELPIGKKNPNLISMILRQTNIKSYMSFDAISNFIEIVGYLVNKKMGITTQKIKIKLI